jgi:hypothetical protein
MTQDKLPADVQHFIHSYIDSVELLWVLLLLHSDPEREWTIQDITVNLKSIDTSIAKRLEDLYGRQVLMKMDGGNEKHRFKPCTPKLDEVIRSLAEQNQLKPYRVMEAIYSRPDPALAAFAEAFKLRGGKS